jgi:hypothetical protein
MRPDQAEFLLWLLLPQLRSEQAITKKILSAVPVDKYTPHTHCMSPLKLAWHIAV